MPQDSLVEKNYSASLNEARLGSDNAQVNDASQEAETKSKIDFSELMMWELALITFWLALGGWLPLWGGVINILQILIIYFWYKVRDLNPPSLRGVSLEAVAKPLPQGTSAKSGGSATVTKVVAKIPGGSDIMFLMSALGGGVGIIPAPMVLFFFIYQANK